MMGQSIMESRTQNARKFHIAMKTVEKYIRMTHVHVEVVRNSKNVVEEKVYLTKTHYIAERFSF